MNRTLALTLAVAGVGLGIAAYYAQINALNSRHAVAQVAIGWAYLFAGLIAWDRRPGNRMGRLMVFAGIAVLARQLRYSDNAFLFTVCFIFGDVGYALIGHSALAYPTGRVTDRAERALVIAGYTTVFVFPALAALFYGGTSPLLYFGRLSRNNLINVTDNGHVVELLQKTEVVVFFGVLATVLRRPHRAEALERDAEDAPGPRALASCGRRGRAYARSSSVSSRSSTGRSPADYLFWWRSPPRSRSRSRSSPACCAPV